MVVTVETFGHKKTTDSEDKSSYLNRNRVYSAALKEYGISNNEQIKIHDE